MFVYSKASQPLHISYFDPLQKRLKASFDFWRGILIENIQWHVFTSGNAFPWKRILMAWNTHCWILDQVAKVIILLFHRICLNGPLVNGISRDKWSINHWVWNNRKDLYFICIFCLQLQSGWSLVAMFRNQESVKLMAMVNQKAIDLFFIFPKRF